MKMINEKTEHWVRQATVSDAPGSAVVPAGDAILFCVIPSEAPKGPTRNLVNLDDRLAREGSNCVEGKIRQNSILVAQISQLI